MNLKSELNLCHKVDILPSELIKYDKEIQTNHSVLHNSKTHMKSSSFEAAEGTGGETTTDEEDLDASGDQNFRHKSTGISIFDFRGNLKINIIIILYSFLLENRGLQLKPLAYFEEVFVHDTFQWEDEFGHHHNQHSHEHGDDKSNLTDKMINRNDSSGNKHNSINGEINNDSDCAADDDDIAAEAIENHHQNHSKYLSYFVMFISFNFLVE